MPAGGEARLTETRVRELIVEGLAAAVPVAVKLIEHQIEARIFQQHGQRALFSDWGHRT